jgi:opacity protein-like surface antigen
MKFQSLIRLLFLVGASCGNVGAQDSPNLDLSRQESTKLDVSLTYSYLHVRASSTTGLGSQSLQGGDLSVSHKVKWPWLRIAGDIGYNTSGYRSSDVIGIKVNGHQTSLLFGPRLVLPLGRLSPYGQALFGVAHANAGEFDTSKGQWAFAWAVGGGLDFRLTHHWALRPIQLEYLRTNFSELESGMLRQDDFRASTGIVFRF